jgi:hypothetical protein
METGTEGNGAQPVVAAEVADLEWTEWAGIVWSFLWRNTVTTVGTVLASALLGVAAGVAVGAGVSLGGGSLASIRGPIKVLSAAVGVSAALFFYYVWIRWLLTSRIGSFRLVLVREGRGR